MPNLETLSIEIDGNSQQASEGISSLIGSLRRLAKAVGTCVPAMREMNASLEVLSKFGTMRLPNFGNQAAQNIAKTTRAITNATAKMPSAEEIRRSNEAMEAIRKANAPAPIPAEARQAQTDWYRNKVNTRLAENEQRRNQLATEGYKKIGQAAEESNNAVAKLNNAMKDTNNNARAFKSIGDEAEKAKPKLSGFGKLMEQIGRIAKTLLIRTALRNLLKSFSETWSAAYEYSKRMGGDFAESVEKARGAIASVSTSLIKTFAPILTAIVPVIQAITSGISYLCTMIQKLFSLLGMTSDLFGASANQIDKYSGSASKGSKATKNLLASFDQLNVIQSQNNGSDVGGSGTKSFLSDMVSEEMSKINIIVAESLMGIGLILACTGHVGLGLGMLAVGTGMFAKAMIEDWDKMPNKVKKTIAEISIVTGVGMMAVGVMAMCAGHVPLGIALLAGGAAISGITMFAAGKDSVDLDVKHKITEIMEIASWGMMAIGLIVAISGNIPLGLGMIALGAATHIAAGAYDPEGLVKIAQGVIDKVVGFFTGAWETIKSAWLTAAKWMDDNVFTPIATFATNAWNTVSTWWADNITNNITAAWNGITEFFQTLFGSTEVPGSIAAFANDAWCVICKWWEENIAGNIKAAWDTVSEFFKNLWGSAEEGTGIAGTASKAWNAISGWWSTNIITPIKTAWDAVGEFFHDLFGGTEVPGSIAAVVNDAWCAIENWWTENIYGSISTAWQGVQKFFTDMFDAILSPLRTIWNFIKDVFGIGSHTANYSLNVDTNVTWDDLTSFTPKKSYYLPDFIKHNADGAYGIPKGDLFIANEAGAELVGSMDGKTTVANNDQIVEGIQAGVRNANADQNELLREQNRLLRLIADKDFSPEPSAAWGKFMQKSNNMWNMATGR